MTAEVTGATKGRRMRGSAGILRVLSDTMVAVRPHRGLLWLLCGFSVLSALAESMLLFIVARLAVAAAGDADRVDIAFGPMPTNDISIRDASIIALVLVVVALALAYPVARLVGVMSRRTLVHLRTTLLGAYLAAPWAERAKDPEGHLQEFVSEYSHRVERIVTAGTVILVGGLSTSVLTIYAFFVAPLASLGLVAGLVVLAFALRPTTKRVKRGSLSFVQANRRLASQVAQTSRVSQEITAFDVAQPVTESLRDDIETSGTLIGQIRFAATFVPMLYQYVALGLVVSMIGVLAVTSPGALAVVAPILLLFIRALGYGRQIQARTQEGVELSPYLEAIELEIARLQGSMPRRPERTASEFETLTFEQVGFAYPGGSSVLDDVSFELRQGDALGVIGPSGAGKSTLMQLLLRLREPTSGRITIDGVDVREIDPAAWARLVAFVPQDNKLIRGTVADNIAFYRAGFTRAEVERAAHEAHLHTDLTSFPDGYDTMIGPGERDLSGGQRQRLGIARALIGRPELLVLDEPTSALDSTSEQLVRRTLQELKGRTTLVIIAHRPGILEVCDRQARVGDGAVDITPSRVDGTAAATP